MKGAEIALALFAGIAVPMVAFVSFALWYGTRRQKRKDPSKTIYTPYVQSALAMFVVAMLIYTLLLIFLAFSE